jgi:hypothetical protein
LGYSLKAPVLLGRRLMDSAFLALSRGPRSSSELSLSP